VQLIASDALKLWHRVTVAALGRDLPDMTQRQFALLLHVYLASPPHTVRGMAAELNMSKPAVTRALDRLSALGLLKRAPDEADRRSILVKRTVAGAVFLRDFGDLAGAEAREV
jgi:DNA-binding MarR family transcriptional regulator